MNHQLFLLLHLVSVLLLTSALPGLAFRMTGQRKMLQIVAVVAIVIAVTMVTYRPF